MMTSEDELTNLKAQSPCLLEHRYLLPVLKIVSMFKGLINKKLPLPGTPRFSITHLRIQAGVIWLPLPSHHWHLLSSPCLPWTSPGTRLSSVLQGTHLTPTSSRPSSH